MNRRKFMCSAAMLASLLLMGKNIGVSMAETDLADESSKKQSSNNTHSVSHTEAEWKEKLTQEEFRVLRKHGTEPPFSSSLNDEKRPGTFVCAACENELFSSEAKYESGTGWPSFYKPVSEDAVGEKTDYKLIWPRTEIHCANCGGHLGHVFEDGPEPTGLRYCINGVALDFEPQN